MDENIMNLLITLAVSILFGLIFIHTPLPAGGLIGAMIASAALGILTNRAYMPKEFRTLTQIAVGAVIGTKLKKSDVLKLKDVVFPIAFMIICMMTLSAGMGVLIHKISQMDLLTSLFCAAPGGIADMTLAGQELGADTSKIVVLQMTRLIAVIGTFPIILKMMLRKLHMEPQKSTDPENRLKDRSSKGKKRHDSKKTKQAVITFIIAAVFGLLGYFLKIPAGTLVFSMSSVVIFNLITGKAYMPIKVKKVAQIFAGAVVGARMTMDDFLGIKTVWVALIVLVFSYLLITLILSFVFHRIFHIELATAMFAFCPGGSADMALVAEDMGADVSVVVVSQSLRVILVIALFPILSQWLSTII